ncbi:ADP-ribosyltransferase exoenzyme [Variovorax sp. PBS-H4]|nr:ADP-ribosyltransferase exoenzyme [Variovorax sp. PBS-H4]
MSNTLKSLNKSDLYKDALKGNEDLATLLPGVLESYLSSLLNNPSALETIKTHELTADEAVAIRWYGREGFQYVQPSLRQKPDPALGEDNVAAPPTTFANLVKACDNGFAKLPPLPHGMELFRGTNFFNADLEAGDVYTDPAFVSTSTSRDVAEQKFQGCFVLKFINIPEGDPSWRDISTLTGNPKEAEVLCLPGRTFRVFSRGEGANAGEGTINNPEIITLEPVFMG